MGLFDLIFGKPKTTKETQPAQVTLTVTDLKKAINESKERKIKDIYPMCQGLSNDAIVLIPKIKNAINKVKSKNIDKETRGYEIAMQMKQKLAERAPGVLDTVKPMKEANLTNIILFHNTLNNAIVLITKITSDNRYLFFFFNEEMKEYGSLMKGLCNINDKIKQLIESKKEVFDEENKIFASLSKYENLQREMESILELDKKFGHEIEEQEKKKEHIGKEINERAVKSKEINQTISKRKEEIENLTRELANHLYRIERPIRKFKRITLNKHESTIIDTFLSNPLETYIEYASGGELKKIFGELKESINKDKNEESKEKEKTIYAIDKLIQESSINSALKISKLQEEMASDNSELQKINYLNREAEKTLLEFEKKNKEYQKNTKTKEETESKIKEIEEEIERISGKFIEKEVKISLK